MIIFCSRPENFKIIKMSESFDDPSLTKFHHFSRQIPHILEDEVIPAPLK